MKKFEFKKLALGLIVFISILWVSFSYILALLEKETNSSIAVASIGSIIGVYIAYCTTSFKEKDSRNKYGIDSDGNKITQESGSDNIDPDNMDNA